METLLEKAKKSSVKKRKLKINEEEIDLVLAWMKDEIMMKDVARVLEITPTAVYGKIALVIREAYIKGKIIIK